MTPGSLVSRVHEFDFRAAQSTKKGVTVKVWGTSGRTRSTAHPQCAYWGVTGSIVVRFRKGKGETIVLSDRLSEGRPGVIMRNFNLMTMNVVAQHIERLLLYGIHHTNVVYFIASTWLSTNPSPQNTIWVFFWTVLNIHAFQRSQFWQIFLKFDKTFRFGMAWTNSMVKWIQ